MKAAELFVKSLETAGVTKVFGVPGEENLAVLEAIRNSSIEFVTTRDEQSAAFMAAAQGRLTGKAGVALATLGPGATNLLNGVAYAQLQGIPLLIITGQKPIKKRRQSMFQTIDIVALMRPVTKFAETVISAHRVPATVHLALRLAEAERPGAVHIELPEDVADEESDVEVPAWRNADTPAASVETLNAIAEAVNSAKLPILLLAGGTNRHDTREAVKNFVEKTGMPFATTQLGKGAMDERSDQYIGTTTLSANDYVHRAFDESDLLVVAGYDYFEKPAFMAKSGRRVISLNYFVTGTDEVWNPDIEAVGDIAGALNILAGKVSAGEWNLDAIKGHNQRRQADIAERAKDDVLPMKPQRAFADLRGIMPDDGVLSSDNGMHKLWMTRNYPAHQPNTVLVDNTLATMGAGLPVAMGVKLLDPKRKVVVVAGDGGFMMNVADLETAVRLKLNLVIVILNDNGYGMIKWKQADMGFTDFAMDFTNPDFVKLAESFGVTGIRIERAEDFAPTVEKALEAGGITLIDLPIDYSENVTLNGSELKARTQ